MSGWAIAVIVMLVLMTLSDGDLDGIILGFLLYMGGFFS